MTGTEKTVFISYRRDVSKYPARLVFNDLRAHGYDVFMDVESIDSGTFDTIILNQIAARAHFVVILAPGSLERCTEPGDWLRQEIERAIELRRNVVPLMFDGFVFKDAKPYLKGKLKQLRRYNALNVHDDFFEAAMEKLRTRYLKQPAQGTIVVTPPAERKAVASMIANASRFSQRTGSPPSQSAGSPSLRTSSPFSRLARSSFLGSSKSAKEHFDRGVICHGQGDLRGAIENYNLAIQANPAYSDAHVSRGNARYALGDLDGASADYTKTIQLAPDWPAGYQNRGFIRHRQGDFRGAVADYSEAIRLGSSEVENYYNRGLAHQKLGQLEAALADFQTYLRRGGTQSADVAKRKIAEIRSAL
jgi:tetratricopeptide (TPR) repeat protein